MNDEGQKVTSINTLPIMHEPCSSSAPNPGTAAPTSIDGINMTVSTSASGPEPKFYSMYGADSIRDTISELWACYNLCSKHDVDKRVAILKTIGELQCFVVDMFGE